MKYLLFLIVLLNLTGCTKTETIHFHGRLTFDCNGQPASYAYISIVRVYDTGTTYSDRIGDVQADANGNFSLMAEVKQHGSLVYYSFEISRVQNTSPFVINYTEFTSNDKDNDVEVHKNISPKRFYRFHIKNSTPVNSSDRFETLDIYTDSTYSSYDPLITWLDGNAVDTNVYLYGTAKTVYYKYSYTKSSTTVNSSPYVLNDTACCDTAGIDIFY